MAKDDPRVTYAGVSGFFGSFSHHWRHRMLFAVQFLVGIRIAVVVIIVAVAVVIIIIMCLFWLVSWSSRLGKRTVLPYHHHVTDNRLIDPR